MKQHRVIKSVTLMGPRDALLMDLAWSDQRAHWSPYLQFVWGSVGGLWGIDPEYVCQTAGHQQTHIFIWMFEEEVWGQVEGQVQVQLLLFLRVLVHVHEGLDNHLEKRDGIFLNGEGKCLRLVGDKRGKQSFQDNSYESSGVAGQFPLDRTLTLSLRTISSLEILSEISLTPGG